MILRLAPSLTVFARACSCRSFANPHFHRCVLHLESIKIMIPSTLGNLFTGKLVRLSAKRPEDKESFARWTADAEYMRQLYFEPAIPRPPEYFEDKKKEQRRESRFNFTLRTIEDDKLIGQSGLGVSWNNQSVWIWLGIGEPDFRGKGYGTDAMRLLVGYSFRELGLYRANLGVFAYNARAIHCYEKVGYVHEGAARSALYREGKRHDVLGMSILRPEWEAQQTAESTATPIADAQPAR